MRSFKDDAGRAWRVSITIGMIRRVRSELADLLPGREIDLLKIDEGKPPLVALLSTNAELLVDVIYETCRSSHPDIEAELFAMDMGGDSMLAAGAAFWGEMRDFFQKLGRDDLVEVIATQHELFKAATAQAAEHYQSLDVEAMAREEMAKQLTENQASRQTPGKDSMSLPESSE